ncbi:NADase-type glycan-binding domain-containing protein [Streptomyces sp. NPDC101165]|uniref:NADase-type glycan-binding domain-containing protein n=1 Tax=Streptomyces sp. NPDC101165 TaxID=3366119 RepID=UPI0037F54981
MGTPAAPEPSAPSPESPSAPAPAPASAARPVDAPTPAGRTRTSSLRGRLTGRGRGEAREPSTPDTEGSVTVPDQTRTTPPPRITPPPQATPPSQATADEPTAARGPAAATTNDAVAADGEDASQGPPAPDDEIRTGGAGGNNPAEGEGEAAPTVPPRRPQAPAPAQDPVGPVRPAKPVAPRPVVRPVAAPDEGTGRPCPACRTLNQPERRFCRRCAAELTPAEKPAPLPWWRTVWPFRRRTRAGSGRAFRFFVILAVVLALCAGGFLLLPAGRALFEDTRDKLGKARSVTPADVKASAEVRGHPATDTTDGLSNHYWGAPGPGASVTYTFRTPFRLVDVIITNGASSSPEEYARQARALQLDMEVTTQDGEKHRKEVTLSDKPGPQTISTGISDAKTVRLVLRSPVGLTRGRHLAVAEVEFFQRS